MRSPLAHHQAIIAAGMAPRRLDIEVGRPRVDDASAI
jgi:hypothetical protein